MVVLANAVRSQALCADAVAKDGRRVATEQSAVEHFEAAMERSAPERGELTAAVRDIEAALERTRHERVIAATREPMGQLQQALGPPPTTPGALATWCGIAEQLEAWRDRRAAAPSTPEQVVVVDHRALGIRPSCFHASQHWDQLRELVDHAPEIVALADTRGYGSSSPLEDPTTWQPALDVAHRGIDARQLGRDESVGLEL